MIVVRPVTISHFQSGGANNVAQVLITQFNISADRMSSVGYGEEKPIADNTAESGRAANRRVMAVISAAVETRAQK